MRVLTLLLFSLFLFLRLVIFLIPITRYSNWYIFIHIYIYHKKIAQKQPITPMCSQKNDVLHTTYISTCSRMHVPILPFCPFPLSFFSLRVLDPERDPKTNRWISAGGDTANRSPDFRRFRERLEQGSLHRPVRKGTEEPQRLSYLGHFLRVPRVDRLQPGSKSLCLGSWDCFPHGLVSNRIIIRVSTICEDRVTALNSILTYVLLKESREWYVNNVAIINFAWQSVSDIFTEYSTNLLHLIFIYFLLIIFTNFF